MERKMKQETVDTVSLAIRYIESMKSDLDEAKNDIPETKLRVIQRQLGVVQLMMRDMLYKQIPTEWDIHVQKVRVTGR